MTSTTTIHSYLSCVTHLNRYISSQSVFLNRSSGNWEGRKSGKCLKGMLQKKHLFYLSVLEYILVKDLDKRLLLTLYSVQFEAAHSLTNWIQLNREVGRHVRNFPPFSGHLFPFSSFSRLLEQKRFFSTPRARWKWWTIRVIVCQNNLRLVSLLLELHVQSLNAKL